jgi:ubiquinone/menaquinone biosynthesis C-methylase UbiE
MTADVAPDPVNRAVWSKPGEVERFARAEGWIDASERALLEPLLSGRRDLDVLDIGVGGGRTVALLAPRARSYVGIDFVPELVEASKRRFPGVDIREGDARSLSFDDASFDLLVFSINGIDAIGHADRAKALKEMRRVLRPDGVLVFSTHNQDGPGPSDRPWRTPPMTIHQPRSSAKALLQRITHAKQSTANYRRLHGSGESGVGWSVETSGAHDFGIVVHYVTHRVLFHELREAGFGGRIDLYDDRVGVPADVAAANRYWYFNVRAYATAPGIDVIA